MHTVGTLAIDNADLTAVTFADAFSSNGISHALDASIFNVTTAGEYSINVEIRVTDGTINAAGLYWVVCRRYKNRTTTDTTGDAYRDYHLGGSYYRDHNAARDDVVLGGNARIHFESTTEQFEIIIRKSYQQNLSTGDLVIDNAVSYLNIEKHDAAGGVDVLSSVLSRLSELESRLGIDIVTGVNDTLMFQHITYAFKSQRDILLVHNRPGRTTVHNRRNANGNKRGDCDCWKCSERDHNDHGVQW